MTFKTLRWILAVALLTGCAKPAVWAPSEANVTGGRTEVPIDLPAHGMPVVEVTQPGSGQKAFGIIDTGAGATMVTPAFASRNHLERRQLADLQMRDALKQTKA